MPGRGRVPRNSLEERTDDQVGLVKNDPLDQTGVILFYRNNNNAQFEYLSASTSLDIIQFEGKLLPLFNLTSISTELDRRTVGETIWGGNCSGRFDRIWRHFSDNFDLQSRAIPDQIRLLSAPNLRSES